jgi:hypothetical protein
MFNNIKEIILIIFNTYLNKIYFNQIKVLLLTTVKIIISQQKTI